MYTVKRLYGRKSHMQLDLAKKIHDFLLFFFNGSIFFDKFSEIWPCKCPANFLRETVVTKRIKDHPKQLPYGVYYSIWLGSESRVMDFYDFFQTMSCSVRVFFRPSHRTPGAGARYYNPSSLIPLAWRGIRLLGKLNPRFRDLCKARAFSGLDE